jgi:hypothetical protein
MTTEPIARYYDASKNPDGAFLPGVPLADLPDALYISFPAWLRASIDACPFYRKTKPPTETAPLGGAPKADKE